MHGADIKLPNNRFHAVGKLPNGFEYEAQLHVLSQGGKLERAA
jgi:alpha-L-fucosidase 2